MRRLIEEAISMCPDNPGGYSVLALVYHGDYVLGNTKSPRETLEKAIELAQKAIAMDDSLPAPHMSLSFFYCFKREYDKAIAEGERGVALYPSGSEAYGAYAAALLFACRPEEAIPLLQKAIRLNPNANPITFVNFGYALLMTGRFEEAVSAFKKALQRAPDHPLAHIGLGATYSLMGREKEARAEAEEILRINPKFSLDHFKKTSPYKDPSEIDKIADALRKAGLK
jgi:adenylate cyclase